MLFPALVQIAMEQRPMVALAVKTLEKALRDEDSATPVTDAETGFRYQRKDVPQKRSVVVRIAAPKGQEFQFRDLMGLNGLDVPAVWVFPDDDNGRVIQATMMASAAMAFAGGSLPKGEVQ